MKNIITLSISIISIYAFTVTPAFAHIIVTPHQVGIAAIQDFTVNVPNEKDNPVTEVRLLIPPWISSVVPNIVPGWTITTKTVGNGDSAEVTEIDWTNGSIPVGQRAELTFQAQVPAKEVTLAWKAYQTYSDGTVVRWDISPKTLEKLSDSQQDALADKENKGEYSTTTVINDLAAPTSQSSPNSEQQNTTWIWLAFGMSVAALTLSIVTFGRHMIQNS